MLKLLATSLWKTGIVLELPVQIVARNIDPLAEQHQLVAKKNIQGLWRHQQQKPTFELTDLFTAMGKLPDFLIILSLSLEAFFVLKPYFGVLSIRVSQLVSFIGRAWLDALPRLLTGNQAGAGIAHPDTGASV